MLPGERAYRQARRRRAIRRAAFLYFLVICVLVFSFVPTAAEWWFGVPVSMRSYRYETAFAAFVSFLIIGHLLERKFSTLDYLSGSNARWLRTTPWRPGKALPFEEPFITFNDVLMLAPVVGLCALMSVNRVWIPLLAVVGAWALWLLLLSIGSKSLKTLAVAALLALACLLPVPAWLKIACAVGGLGALWAGTRRRDVAFDLIEPPPTIDRFLSQPGWVRRQMPVVQHAPLARGTGLWAGALVFWLVFCGFYTNDLSAEEQRTGVSILVALALVIAVARWAIYVARHNAPISVRGRFNTGTRLIPGHDRVLVAPLISTAAVLVVVTGCLILELPFALAVALPPAIALALCLELGPTLQNWTLTGPHNVPRTALKEVHLDTASSNKRRR